MDPRIELVVTEEDELYARQLGVALLTVEQCEQVVRMSRAERRAWTSRHQHASPKTLPRTRQRKAKVGKARRKQQRAARKANR
jgi:hypothetical protein